MASEHIQACLVGSSPVPLHILFSIEHISIAVGRASKEDLRGGGGVLQRVQRPNTTVFRLGFLRQYRYDPMVESIHGDTLARLDRGFRVSHHSRQRRKGSTNASNHRQVHICFYIPDKR